MININNQGKVCVKKCLIVLLLSTIHSLAAHADGPYHGYLTAHATNFYTLTFEGISQDSRHTLLIDLKFALNQRQISKNDVDTMKNCDSRQMRETHAIQVFRYFVKLGGAVRQQTPDVKYVVNCVKVNNPKFRDRWLSVTDTSRWY